MMTVNVIRQMAPILSKVDSNKLWLDVQNEETVIYAKFGKDLFNISKVIGRKTKWPWVFGLPGNSCGETKSIGYEPVGVFLPSGGIFYTIFSETPMSPEHFFTCSAIWRLGRL